MNELASEPFNTAPTRNAGRAQRGSAKSELASVDQQAFRDVVGRFTSGVTVITTAVDGARFGTTASRDCPAFT